MDTRFLCPKPAPDYQKFVPYLGVMLLHVSKTTTRLSKACAILEVMLLHVSQNKHQIIKSLCHIWESCYFMCPKQAPDCQKFVPYLGVVLLHVSKTSTRLSKVCAIFGSHVTPCVQNKHQIIKISYSLKYLNSYKLLAVQVVDK